MTQMQRVTVFGVVILGVFACSSEVPIGEGIGTKTGALGGIGQAPKSDGSCDTRLTLCSGSCRDLSADNANCGACGTACTGTNTCVSDVCTAPAPPPPPVDAGPADSAPPTCPFGQDLCGGACVDVLFDSANCGSCGVSCGGGTKCVRGLCM